MRQRDEERQAEKRENKMSIQGKKNRTWDHKAKDDN